MNHPTNAIYSPRLISMPVPCLRRVVPLASLLGGLLLGVGHSVRAAEVTVDFAQSSGTIRPLHGVNFGPLCYRGTVDLTAYHREIGVPHTRLHDVVWLNAEAVDIHTIFRDFRNDPSRADSYDFRATDDYLQAIINAGSQIVYRLGESIEHTPRKYWVHPPADAGKWASICVGIIRHYNEGWADGFRHDIRYWEIWNEPDVRPAMWTGTDEQFFQLYEVTAKTIKARFPGVKVGGPAVGGTGEFTANGFKPARFLTNFLAHCRAHDAPLDFFSWHIYTQDPWKLPALAKAMRGVLDDYGFKKTESHLNEWNYLPRDDWHPMLKDGQGTLRAKWYEEMGGPAGAAFAACGLMMFQDVPLDVANFYTGDIQGFGLFDISGVPKKSFHAFRAFRALLDCPQQVRTEGGVAGQSVVCAGMNARKDRAAILFSQFKPSGKELGFSLRQIPWAGATEFEVLAVDSKHNLDRVQSGRLDKDAAALKVAVESPGVLLIKLRPAHP